MINPKKQQQALEAMNKLRQFKLLANDLDMSLASLRAIARYYDISPWTLYVNFEKVNGYKFDEGLKFDIRINPLDKSLKQNKAVNNDFIKIKGYPTTSGKINRIIIPKPFKSR